MLVSGSVFIQKYASLRSLQKYPKIFSGVILVGWCRCTPSIVAKLSVCCSSQLGIIQLLYPLMLHYRASLLPIISNVLRTIHRIYLPSVELMMFCRTLLRFCLALLRTAPASADGICVKTLPAAGDADLYADSLTLSGWYTRAPVWRSWLISQVRFWRLCQRQKH